MKSPDSNDFNIGLRLTLTFALLIAFILGGNGLLVWQFHRARLETDRLTGVSQQLVAVLRLQQGLQAFHLRLDELAQSKDAPRLLTEGEQLRRGLLEQTQRARSAVSSLPPGTVVNPAFAPTLDAIEITLPTELERITALAGSADWEAVRLRLDNQLKPVETLTSTLVKSIDQDVSEELPQAVAKMTDVQHRIFVIIPATAIATFFIAALFGSAMARRMLELRLEERVHERTRIARELHDTLLQSFQGLLFSFQSAIDLLPGRPHDARERLQSVVDRAEQALTEGRNAVQALRSSTEGTNDLAVALNTLAAELATNQSAQNFPAFEVRVEGAPRDLDPILRDDVYRIGGEALRNAFQHAEANRIEVEIHYDEHELRLRIRDDGRGMDSDILAEKRGKGYFGIRGMHERARLVGGKMEVWSKRDSGTEIDLSIPGRTIYMSSRA